MIEAGTDIFRLNCSHRRGGDFERVYPLIRKAAHELGRKAGFALQLWIGILVGFLSFVMTATLVEKHLSTRRNDEQIAFRLAKNADKGEKVFRVESMVFRLSYGCQMAVRWSAWVIFKVQSSVWASWPVIPLN